MNAPKILNITVVKNGKSRLKFSVKEMAFETTAPLTDEGQSRPQKFGQRDKC